MILPASVKVLTIDYQGNLHKIPFTFLIFCCRDGIFAKAVT